MTVLHIVTLRGDKQRAYAKTLVDGAPIDAIVTIREATRNLDQNARMWAMLADVSKAMPEGRRHTSEDWKCLFMHACGWEVQFLDGLDGRPFPSGFSSSRMTVRQMSDLIEFIFAYGDTHGVAWSEPHPDERAVAANLVGTTRGELEAAAKQSAQ